MYNNKCYNNNIINNNYNFIIIINNYNYINNPHKFLIYNIIIWLNIINNFNFNSNNNNNNNISINLNIISINFNYVINYYNNSNNIFNC
mmetsp:Transcript_29708/g.40819  ORF Transcript_29708/g.40819 Transcript_29708/m.40819 type:complete len:89 (-) Transcript_29708:203-469(-)